MILEVTQLISVGQGYCNVRACREEYNVTLTGPHLPPLRLPAGLECTTTQVTLVDEQDGGMLSAHLFKSPTGVLADPKTGKYLAGGFQCHVLIWEIKTSHASGTPFPGAVFGIQTPVRRIPG